VNKVRRTKKTNREYAEGGLPRTRGERKAADSEKGKNAGQKKNKIHSGNLRLMRSFSEKEGRPFYIASVPSTGTTQNNKSSKTKPVRKFTLEKGGMTFEGRGGPLWKSLGPGPKGLEREFNLIGGWGKGKTRTS